MIPRPPYTFPAPTGEPLESIGRSLFGEDLRWRCHVCGYERLDRLIDVYKDSKPILGGRSRLTVNVRFCADRNACRAEAPLIAKRWLEAIE